MPSYCSVLRMKYKWLLLCQRIKDQISKINVKSEEVWMFSFSLSYKYLYGRKKQETMMPLKIWSWAKEVWKNGTIIAFKNIWVARRLFLQNCENHKFASPHASLFCFTSEIFKRSWNRLHWGYSPTFSSSEKSNE